MSLSRLLWCTPIFVVGCKPGLKAFTVDPPCVCKGGTITMRWEVAHGAPTITVDHPPAGWADEQFACSGSRTYRATEDAEFIAVVPGANPANGDGKRRQSVTVVDGAGSATTSTPECNDKVPERAMRGQMQPVSSCQARVLMVHDPVVQATTATGDVSNTPRTICLVPPSGAKICVAPGETKSIGAVLDASWAIEIPLLDTEQCGPTAPALGTLQLELDCNALQQKKGT